MERLTAINPQRIAWCCADRGITLDTLAAETGIAIATLDRAGQRGLTFGQLERLANYFGRGVLFFLEEGPVAPEVVHTTAFRTLTNQKPELSAKVKTFIERAEKQRAVFIALREELGEQYSYQAPAIRNRDPRQAAVAVRQWLGLDRENTFESYRSAVERRGILVFRSNGYSGKWQIAKQSPILGFSLYDAACPLIVVKKLRWETRQTFTLMHELGHLVLHRESSIDDEGDFNSHEGHEREANVFAAHLLVPDELLALIHDQERPDDTALYDDWLQTVRRLAGVSTEVVLRRLTDAGRFPLDEYRRYRQWWSNNNTAAEDEDDDRGSRAYRHREPKHIFGDTFVRTVLDALDAKRITLTKASDYLDSLKIKDLHLLERHYASL